MTGRPASGAVAGENRRVGCAASAWVRSALVYVTDTSEVGGGVVVLVAVGREGV